MSKALPKIAKCRCRKRGRIVGGPPSVDVACENPVCWVGPSRHTERGAILAWNKVMEEKP